MDAKGRVLQRRVQRVAAQRFRIVHSVSQTKSCGDYEGGSGHVLELHVMLCILTSRRTRYHVAGNVADVLLTLLRRIRCTSPHHRYPSGCAEA